MTTGTCNWDAIKLIKEHSTIPIIGNGGVENYKDVLQFLDFTKCDAVMSAEKLLEIPYLFAGETDEFDIDTIALEYCYLAREDNIGINIARSHLHKMLYGACKVNIIIQFFFNS